MADFVERRITSSGQVTNANVAKARNQPYIDTVVNGKKARVYGSQEQLNQYEQKFGPDGKLRRDENGVPLYKKANDSEKVNRGEATVITGFDLQGAIQDFQNGEPVEQITDPNKTSASSGSKLPNVQFNPLEQFASYTPLWTMACLTTAQFNQPQLYRDDPASLKNIIFSSAGRFNSQRVRTFHGSPEYFVQSFEMKSVIAASPETGNTNAVLFELEIYEPYSMGLLLQSMQNAAVKSGYANYLDNAPYVFRLDIQGYDETGKEFKQIKPKFFVCKITKSTFEVNEGGSTYRLTAVPYNHSGYSDTINTLFKDIAISPGKKGTLKELLVEGSDSLVTYLNRNEYKLVEEGLIGKPDVYTIEFPTKSEQFVSSVTANPNNSATVLVDQLIQNAVGSVGSNVIFEFGDNPIGNSTFGFDESNGGNYPFSRASDVYDEETGRIVRDKLVIDPKRRLFQFKQAQKLTDIILECILNTKYAAETQNNKNIDDNGFITWFRIDTQIQFLDYDELIGDYSRLITYRIVPFKVHHSVFTNPSSPPLGYDKLEKKIVKAYNYIYTGQNTDVLKFDINIKHNFYTGIYGSPVGLTGDEVEKNQGGIVIDGNTKTPVEKGKTPEAQVANLGRERIRRKIIDQTQGGPGVETLEKQIALAFNNALVNNNVDLVNLNLEILGDPYWLVDSGIANYFSPPAEGTELINEDGTANYEGNDVYIYITFRTPADVNDTTGLYNFSKEEVISPFSGIYKVTRCTSFFEDGVFKQTLRCIRMRGQTIDYDETLDKDKASSNLINQEIVEAPTSESIESDVKESKFKVDVGGFIQSAVTQIINSSGEKPNQPPPSADTTGENVQTETGEQEEQPTDSETVSEEDTPDFEETPLAEEETRLSDNEAGVVESQIEEIDAEIAQIEQRAGGTRPELEQKLEENIAQQDAMQPEIDRRRAIAEQATADRQELEKTYDKGYEFKDIVAASKAVEANPNDPAAIAEKQRIDNLRAEYDKVRQPYRDAEEAAYDNISPVSRPQTKLFLDAGDLNEDIERIKELEAKKQNLLNKVQQ